jgi:hypothetical protein
LIWSSSAGCGDAAWFLTELDRRTTRLRPARDGEHAITLIVELFGARGGVRGQLTVRKPDGDLTVREVPGPNCQEVESAMALIVALMVDPLASGSRRVSTSESRVRALPERAAGSSWSLRVEQRATARTAVAPGLSPGQALGLMLTRERGPLRPSLALAGSSARGVTSQSQGSAEFEWLAAQLSVCPVGFQPGPDWDVRACGIFQAGRLRGSGFQTIRPGEKSIFWSAGGLELEGRLRLVGLLWLGLEGGLELPFSRAEFHLDPKQTLHQVPSAGASFGLGLGLRFF